jgi:hypothetical protein
MHECPVLGGGWVAKPIEITLGASAIFQDGSSVRIITPLYEYALDCPDGRCAFKLAKALRQYVEVVDVTLSPADVKHMIEVIMAG